MTVFRRILCLSTAVLVTFVGILLLKNGIATGSSDCSSFDFPCEDGGCIDAAFWCDSQEDCTDGSDEKYCALATQSNDNPNNCPSGYFKCNNGHCIPMNGKCDGYGNCLDSSDEENCGQAESSSESVGTSSTSKPTTRPMEMRTSTSTTSKPVTLPMEMRTSTSTTSKPVTRSMEIRTTAATSSEALRTTTQQPRAKVEPQSTQFFEPSKSVQHSVGLVYSDFKHSDYSHQREESRNWLLSQRRSDFGWGDETPRALTALYLSDVRPSINRNERDLLMVKQLEVQLSLDMSRNGTKTMKLADLALYINALLASCKDPKNFYGENLVNTLRNGVDAVHKETKFVNPSVYLTLCLNNASTYDDARKLHDIFLSRNAALGRIDIQALALLTVTCIYRNTNFLNASMYDNQRRQFLQRMNAGVSPGNVYEASLLLQALQELQVTLPGLMDYILKQQQEDGSFGGILATYLALPVLDGRSFLHMNEHCSQKFTTDLAPIEVLKNTKRRKIYVQYSLKYGFPLEVTETLQMQVAEGINFLDVMRLAQEINPKFRFKLDGNRDVPVVYSIGGIPNDAEKGMFWTLHLVSSSRSRDAGRLAPYSGSIKQLIPHPGDEIVFWMKSL